MRTAACACGQVEIRVEGEPALIGVCSCGACQRRTGSPFAQNAYWDRQQVQEIKGETRVFRRIAETGRWIDCHFCTACGSTVYWYAEFAPERIGTAVGCFADPAFPPPRAISYVSRKHAWVTFPEGLPARDKSALAPPPA